MVYLERVMEADWKQDIHVECVAKCLTEQVCEIDASQLAFLKIIF